MGRNLAVRSKRPRQEVLPAPSASISTVQPVDEVRRAAAELLAAGFSAKQVARALVNHLSPVGNETSAYSKLRRWMRKDREFRDLIFEQAVIKLDLSTPAILDGVAKKAKRGRVDAARFALEVTGRHTPNAQPVVTNVTVQVANIPRPQVKDSA